MHRNTRNASQNEKEKTVKLLQPQEDNRSSSPEEIMDFSVLCRTCASTSEYLIPIYEGEGQMIDLKGKIQKFLPIQVKANDELPIQICYQCTSTLLAWNELVQTCQKSQKILEDRLSKMQKRQLGSKANTIQSAALAEPSTSKENKESHSKQQDNNEKCTEQQVPIVKLQAIDLNATSIGTDTKNKCQFCNTTYSNDATYRRHIISTHADRMFQCGDCGVFVDKEELLDHMMSHIEDDEVDNSDTKDNIKAENEQAFTDHSDSNDGFDRIPDSIFEAIDELKTDDEQTGPDKKSSPENGDKKNLTCSLCSKTFRAPSSYFYHKKFVHGNNKEKECKICNRKFSTKGALNDHMTIHTGSKNHQCSHCGKQFRSKASVYIHTKNMHSDTKEFVCTQCNLSFRWKQKLLRHLHTHTKEKNHFCTECNKGFSMRSDLTRHMSTHTSQKPYQCNKCDARFSQKRYLKLHLDKKHQSGSNEGKDRRASTHNGLNK